MNEKLSRRRCSWAALTSLWHAALVIGAIDSMRAWTCRRRVLLRNIQRSNHASVRL